MKWKNILVTPYSSGYSKLLLIEHLERVLAIPSDEELKWQMKISLDKYEIIHSEYDSTGIYIQLWAFN